MLNSLFCKLRGHRANRRRVWHDKVDFRTSCQRCNAPLLRDEHRGWREFAEHDGFEGRETRESQR